MNQYHLRVNIGGEENIFLIESNSPDNALKEGIDWADGNYKSIEVFQGHPSDGILECKSEDSAPFKTLPTKIEFTVADPKMPPMLTAQSLFLNLTRRRIQNHHLKIELRHHRTQTRPI